MMEYYCTSSMLQIPRDFFFFFLLNVILCVIIDQMFITKCDVYHISYHLLWVLVSCKPQFYCASLRPVKCCSKNKADRKIHRGRSFPGRSPCGGHWSARTRLSGEHRVLGLLHHGPGHSDGVLDSPEIGDGAHLHCVAAQRESCTLIVVWIHY